MMQRSLMPVPEPVGQARAASGLGIVEAGDDHRIHAEGGLDQAQQARHAERLVIIAFDRRRATGQFTATVWSRCAAASPRGGTDLFVADQVELGVDDQ